MSDDIERRVRDELQELLDANPEIAPTQFIDGNGLATVSVVEGLPHVARTDIPTASRYGCPHLAELRGTPVYRIYNIMQSWQCLNEEGQREGIAQILARTSVEQVEAVKMGPPQLPPAAEVINSTVGGDIDLRSKPNAFGLLRNLESLQERCQEMLAQHPELEPLILKTPNASVEIRVAEQRLVLSSTPLHGRPYAEVRETPQVRIYVLHQTIQGLEATLYGQAREIKVRRRGQRNRAEENLIHHLRQMSCGNLMVLVRRSRKNLFISGPERQIIYLPVKVRVTGEGHFAEEETQLEPQGYTRSEYGALAPEVKQLLNAFFAYLSSKVSNASHKH